MASTKPMTFYDEHPFDWAPTEPSTALGPSIPRLLVDFIDEIEPRSLVLDIGCGPGRVLGLLRRRGLRCIGLDRSRVSVGIAVERCGVPGVVGDNLMLPIAADSVDAVISDGVIHHTDDPAQAFAENYRALKPGGRMYLAVYKPSGRYPFLYKYPGAAIRRGLQHPASKLLVLLLAQVPYFLVHFVRSGGKRTWAGARNLFYDYFVSPRVEFISESKLRKWAAARGAEILRYDKNRGFNVHSFLLRKKAAQASQRAAQSPEADEVLAGPNRETS
jgi:SAM-dependent methyltransferase